MAKIKTVQIAFNLEDPYQEKLYNYFKGQGKNASLYGKMLIQNDMDKNSHIEQDPANDEKGILTKREEDFLYVEEIKPSGNDVIISGPFKLIK